MLFGKKQRYHTLDRGLLAEAISLHSEEINAILKQPAPEDSYHLNTNIRLTEVLEIKISYIGYTCSYSWRSHFFSMSFETYLRGVRMADYHCILDLWCNSGERFRRWGCREAKIFHYMPNQFIDLMNDWSKQTVSAFEERCKQENDKIEAQRKKTYDEEEAILSIYR